MNCMGGRALFNASEERTMTETKFYSRSMTNISGINNFTEAHFPLHSEVLVASGVDIQGA